MMVKTKITRENYLEGNSGSSGIDTEEKGWNGGPLKNLSLPVETCAAVHSYGRSVGA
jgi:hypothetical protein